VGCSALADLGVQSLRNTLIAHEVQLLEADKEGKLRDGIRDTCQNDKYVTNAVITTAQNFADNWIAFATIFSPPIIAQYDSLVARSRPFNFDVQKEFTANLGLVTLSALTKFGVNVDPAHPFRFQLGIKSVTVGLGVPPNPPNNQHIDLKLQAHAVFTATDSNNIGLEWSNYDINIVWRFDPAKLLP
jgi:hypothetical protein